MSRVWFLYVLCCADGTLYTGITTDPGNRLMVHNIGKGAKYTRARLPVEMLIYVPVGDRSMASKLEYRFKQLSRKQKLVQVECSLAGFLQQQSNNVDKND